MRPQKPTTSGLVRASARIDWWWTASAVISPFAVLLILWRTIDFIVALARLVHFHHY